MPLLQIPQSAQEFTFNQSRMIHTFWMVLAVACNFAVTPVLAQTEPRETLDIVGSSTVYPFAQSVAAQHVVNGFKHPVLKSTGTGGGAKLFCQGVGLEFADISNASRAFKTSEREHCATNGVEFTEVQIGYDGIVLAHAAANPLQSLTQKHLYLAVAAQVPTDDTGSTLRPNPYTNWQQIDPTLPDLPILIVGPGEKSGTYDAFLELALVAGCQMFPALKAMKATDKAQYKANCTTVRQDKVYVEAGENDKIIVSMLQRRPHALGIFGFSYLQHAQGIVATNISGIAPTIATIGDGTYPLARPLYFYVKNAHLDRVPGLRQYVQSFVTEAQIGANGALVQLGLIPLSAEELATTQAKVAALP